MDGDIIILPETRPTRADAVKNRALLLETAQRLFETQGVDAVSMSAVAEAAGVGKGTLYRHFTNKTELCLALLDQDQRALQERTFEYLRTDADPHEKLRWFVGQVLDFVMGVRDWLVVGAFHEGASVLEHPAHLWWRQTIYALLTQMNVPGDRDYKADAIYVMLNAHSVEFQLNVLGYTRERIYAGILDLIDRLVT
jgi:AcrR family transcriptional regulator